MCKWRCVHAFLRIFVSFALHVHAWALIWHNEMKLDPIRSASVFLMQIWPNPYQTPPLGQAGHRASHGSKKGAFCSFGVFMPWSEYLNGLAEGTDSVNCAVADKHIFMHVHVCMYVCMCILCACISGDMWYVLVLTCMRMCMRAFMHAWHALGKFIMSFVYTRVCVCYAQSQVERLSVFESHLDPLKLPLNLLARSYQGVWLCLLGHANAYDRSRNRYYCMFTSLARMLHRRYMRH